MGRNLATRDWFFGKAFWESGRVYRKPHDIRAAAIYFVQTKVAKAAVAGETSCLPASRHVDSSMRDPSVRSKSLLGVPTFPACEFKRIDKVRLRQFAGI